MNAKSRILRERIQRLEDEIAKGREYLESGKHAHWHGFRPWFVRKVRDGRMVPPHEGWVRNVFLPRREKALARELDSLDRVTRLHARGRRT